MKLLNETDFETAEGYEAYVLVVFAHAMNSNIDAGKCYEIAIDHILEYGGISPADALMLAKWFSQTEGAGHDH